MVTGLAVACRLGTLPVQFKSGCATPCTLQPRGAEGRIAEPMFVRVTVTGWLPGLTGDTGELIAVPPASFAAWVHSKAPGSGVEVLRRSPRISSVTPLSG